MINSGLRERNAALRDAQSAVRITFLFSYQTKGRPVGVLLFGSGNLIRTDDTPGMNRML